MATILTSAAQTAHSAVSSLLAHAQIKVGETLPAATVKEDNPEMTITLNNLPGRNIILGVPAAFSPPCSSQLPAYLEKYEEFKGKGIRGIYVVAVNDAFVTKAWKEKLASGGTPVHFIADDTSAFTAGLGLIFDASPLLGGPRSKRYALIVDEGRVTHIAVEQNAPDVTVTAADVILAQV